METIIIHADVRETQEQTMARFNAGLNYSIWRIVNHHPYTTMVELMHQAREAEKQVHDDTKYAARQRYSPGSFSQYSKATPAGRSTQPESSSATRSSAGKKNELLPPSSRKSAAPAASGSSSMGSSAHARDKECHKCKGLGHFMKDCPNNKVMILTDEGYISEDEDINPFADYDGTSSADEQVDCRPGSPDAKHFLVCARASSVCPRSSP
jgi:hypothetical protein